MKENCWLTTGEAGRRIGLSRDQVLREIHAGRLLADRTSLGFLLRPEDVDRFAQRRAGSREAVAA